MLAWIIRLGGLLHPQAYTSDLGLHVNNLVDVVRGTLIFTENLPGEAGGGPAPYPPAQYVMLLPGLLLLPAGHLVSAGNALADSLTIAWVWLLLRSAGATPAMGLFAGGLYLFATPLLKSLSVGEMANVWGQALVTPLFLLLYRWQVALLPSAILAAALAVTLLAHFGVFLSLMVFFGVYLVMLVIERDPWPKLGAVLGGVLLLHAVAALCRSPSGSAASAINLRSLSARVG
jgi:hypothetical protein